ncbi:MAG TPA: PhnD/SsuA/transferrin family substrate-binding protein [Rhodopseudomonas sp.]|uniref:phosphate/phosphite/phosphonate ABC transporter substrate-binding protein n=1 Tax=Rhodopseudomonas sp. TaxID=1078 RepID=UPI002ED88549
MSTPLTLSTGTMPWIANARMYAVDQAAAAAWRELFGWLAATSNVDLQVIDHAFPAPLSELWSRPDLGYGFMCGLPFTRAAPKPQPVAAPLLLNAPVPGRPLYQTRLVVRAESNYQSLEDTFGSRLGYTVADSHSGYNALRHHLLPYWRSRGQLYRESIGPLVTPQRVIEAVLAGDIDVGPLDGYALDLMLRHQPEFASQIRIVASTDAAPIPFLVASPQCPADVVEALRSALLTFGDDASCAALREKLCLQGFAPVHVTDYDVITAWAAEADAAGYAQPG